jgi:hypothetical protein
MSVIDVTQEFAVNAAPVAQFTWSLGRVLLLATEEKSGVIPVRFSRPVEILGFQATVISQLPLAGNLAIPSVDDIDVYIDIDQETKLTSQVNEDGPQTGFVPLPHVLTEGNPGRLLRVQPNAPAPDFQFQFSWAQFAAGTPLYEDAIIALSLAARYLPKGG